MTYENKQPTQPCFIPNDGLENLSIEDLRKRAKQESEASEKRRLINYIRTGNDWDPVDIERRKRGNFFSCSTGGNL